MARSSEPRSELVRSQTARLDGGRCLCESECVVWAVGERGDRCACARCVHTAPAFNHGHAESSFTSHPSVNLPDHLVTLEGSVRWFSPGAHENSVRCNRPPKQGEKAARQCRSSRRGLRPWIAGAGQSCLRPSRPSLRCCSWLCMTRSRDAGGSPKAERSAGPPPTPCEKQRPVAEAAPRLPRRLRWSRPSEQTLLP